MQELCGLSKHLQLANRGLLLTKLSDLGLFEVRAGVINGNASQMCWGTISWLHHIACFECTTDHSVCVTVMRSTPLS